MAQRESTVLRRLLWFVGLWAAGVMAIGVVGFAIKLILAA